MLKLHWAAQAVVSADIRLMELRAEEAELNCRLGNLNVDGTDGEAFALNSLFTSSTTTTHSLL